MTAERPLDGTFKLLAVLPPQVRHDMVRMYCESVEAHVMVLGQMLARPDAPAAQAAAHKIAGSAGMMQDRELSGAAHQVEVALREGRADEALRHWPGVQERATITLACLRGADPAAQL